MQLIAQESADSLQRFSTFGKSEHLKYMTHAFPTN